MLIPLQNSYLCGSDHVTSSSIQCECGSRNLMSLARILDRVSLNLDEQIYDHHIMLQESVPRLWEN